MLKKIIIFDLDGTLLNTLEDLTYSTNFALEQFGYPILSVEKVRSYVGDGVNKLIERAIPNGIDNPNFEICVSLFKANYQNNMYNKTKPYSGIKELLSYLKNKGIKIAVVSNKFDKAVKELCEKYFPSMIDIALGENIKEGIRKKPAPDTVYKVLEHFGMTSDEAIYIGDSEVDIKTALNSNLPCISVTWGFKNREFLIKNGAEIIVDSPNEIIKYIG